MSEEETLKMAIIKMFMVYSDEPKADMLIDLYCKSLSEYEVGAVRKAITKAVKTCKFAPKPAEIIALMNPSDEDVLNKAKMEWLRYELYVLNRSEPDLKRLENDEITHYLATTKFNRKRFESVNNFTNSLPFIEKEFVEMYVSYYKSETMQEHIALDKGTESVQIKSLASALKPQLKEGK